VFLGRDIARATAPPLNFEGRWFFHFSVEKAEGLKAQASISNTIIFRIKVQYLEIVFYYALNDYGITSRIAPLTQKGKAFSAKKFALRLRSA